MVSHDSNWAFVRWGKEPKFTYCFVNIKDISKKIL